MSATVISIGTKRRATWSLLEVAQPGRAPVAFGILLFHPDHVREHGDLTLRLRDLTCFEYLEEQDIDILERLADDLRDKGREMGGQHLLESLEDSLSCFLRISERTAIAYSGDPRAVVDRLFDEHVDATVRRFVTHLPLYSLRAAATKFGELMDVDEDGWIRAPENLRLTNGMFVARVVGRSMEPRIPDDSLCIFRAPVTGSRYGRLLLIEMLRETDFSARYTVKRYMRPIQEYEEGRERETPVYLQPLNPEFESFDVTGDEFRVIAEFVQVLPE
jgi:hypothetical protein